MDLEKDEVEEITAAETKTEESESVAPSAKKDTTVSTPTPAPVTSIVMSHL